MSAAYQCDRCKLLYSEDFIQRNVFSGKEEIAKIEKVFVGNAGRRPTLFKETFKKIDLCPWCTEAFLNLFMKHAPVDGERGFFAVDWKRKEDLEKTSKEKLVDDQESEEGGK